MAAALPGYIHPDEFFQGPEPMAAGVLQLNATFPWEFDRKPPCRSVVAAALTAGIPYGLLRLSGIPDDNSTAALAVLLCPRLWMVMLSVVPDTVIMTYCHVNGFPNAASPALLMVGTAWAGLLLQGRPFSNSVEAALVAIAIYIGFCYRPITSNKSVAEGIKSERNRFVLLGMVAAVGIWVRITFVIPSAVCGLYMLTRNSQISAFSAQDVLSQVMAGGAAASVVGVSMAMLDSLYFGTLFLSLDGTTAVGLTDFPEFGRWSELRWVGGLTFTPLNSYLYNSDNSNLAEHGLHPWYTHIFVNLPMLFGPVVLYLVADTLTGMASVMDEVKEVSEQFLPPHMRKKIKDRRDKIAKKDKKESKKEAKAGKAKTDGGKKAKKEAKAAAKKEEEKAMVSEAVAEAEADKKAEKKKKKRKKERVIDPHAAFHDMPGMMVMSYVFVLSFFPHQEARFLLPVLMPMSLLFGHRMAADGSWMMRCGWLVHNVVMLVGFGGLHQAGVTRAVSDLGVQFKAAGPAEGGATPAVVFFHTYMPPRALAVQPRAAAAGLFEMVDMASVMPIGDDGARLTVSVDDLQNTFDELSQAGHSPLFVVAPGTLGPNITNHAGLAADGGVVGLERSWWPHLSGEDPPDGLAEFLDFERTSLLMYRYTPAAGAGV